MLTKGKQWITLCCNASVCAPPLRCDNVLEIYRSEELLPQSDCCCLPRDPPRKRSAREAALRSGEESNQPTSCNPCYPAVESQGYHGVQGHQRARQVAHPDNTAEY